MTILTREQILAADDLKLQLVEVPEWGGAVYVRLMNGIERDKWEEWCAKTGASLEGIRARMASLCMVDEGGNRLFEDSDVGALCKKSAAALERVIVVIQKHNAITDEDVKDLAKN